MYALLCTLHKTFEASLCSRLQAISYPGGTSGKEPACQCRRCKSYGFNPWVRKIPWRRKWQPIPVFSPGESHGQRNSVGSESDTIELTEQARLSVILVTFIYSRASSNDAYDVYPMSSLECILHFHNGF